MITDEDMEKAVELRLLDTKNPKWDELYGVVCEITDWKVGGYECFAVSKLENYVQSRISNVLKESGK